MRPGSLIVTTKHLVTYTQAHPCINFGRISHTLPGSTFLVLDTSVDLKLRMLTLFNGAEVSYAHFYIDNNELIDDFVEVIVE